MYYGIFICTQNLGEVNLHQNAEGDDQFENVQTARTAEHRLDIQRRSNPSNQK